MCRLGTKMTEFGTNYLVDIENIDLVFLENIGNLVCSVKFDIGLLINMNIF